METINIFANENDKVSLRLQTYDKRSATSDGGSGSSPLFGGVGTVGETLRASFPALKLPPRSVGRPSLKSDPTGFLETNSFFGLSAASLHL